MSSQSGATKADVGPNRILVTEPTYADSEHAAVNAGLLEAIAIGCGAPIFASTRKQHDAVREAGNPEMLPRQWHELAVMPPGGVHLRRMFAQWRALAPQVAEHQPAVLVLLSAGPETLFVARLLVLRHPTLRILAVMHGNLATAIGWRSRDPRRRLIDLRAGLRAVRHARIRLVVLEEHIREAAIRHGLGRDIVVWPHVVLENEMIDPAQWTPPARLRLAFVGTANRHKGFGDFLALRDHIHTNCAPVSCDLAVVGRPSAEYDATALDGIEVPAQRLPRAGFLGALRRADYAFVAFRGEYELTASGSLLDCINQRKPLIAVRNHMLTALERQHGPFGYLCDDLAGVCALFDDTAALRDTAAYAIFQRTLDSIARSRLPRALAGAVKRSLEW